MPRAPQAGPFGGGAGLTGLRDARNFVESELRQKSANTYGLYSVMSAVDESYPGRQATSLMVESYGETGRRSVSDLLAQRPAGLSLFELQDLARENGAPAALQQLTSANIEGLVKRGPLVVHVEGGHLLKRVCGKRSRGLA